jgi:NADP-dependent 3-hydroxy acid dehydrogenase YdfG
VDLHAIEMEVVSLVSVDATIENVFSEQGRIDTIVHNAGHMTFGLSEAFTVEQLAEIYDVNVMSAQRVNRAVLPIMRRQRNGLLV